MLVLILVIVRTPAFTLALLAALAILPVSCYATFSAEKTKVFGAADFDETGDSLVESVLAESQGGGLGLMCTANFVSEAIIDREVVSFEMIHTIVASASASMPQQWSNTSFDIKCAI